MRLSAYDRKILNCIQGDIPFDSEPFKILSKQVGIEEEEFIQKVKDLKAKGLIRKFTAGLNHRKLGFTSSLIALKLPSNKIELIAKKIIKNPEITHCFQREGEYNLWVVFLSLKKQKLKDFIKKWAKEVGRKNILNLKTRRQFKLRTRLKI